MAKTLKFALSALALVNGHKPRDDVQHAYNQFLKDFGKSYDSVEKQAGCHGWYLHLSHSKRTRVTRVTRVARDLVKDLHCLTFPSLSS